MLLIYLDESGNYTFSRNGSEYLIYTAISFNDSFPLQSKLCQLEQDLIQRQIIIQSGYFHATEDQQIVRDEVFNILKNNSDYKIDSVIVEKSKANPSLYTKWTTKKSYVQTKIYKKVYKILLKYILARHAQKQKILIFIDEAPDSKKQHEFEKGFKEAMKEILVELNLINSVRYEIQYSRSLFNYGLQAVDYCCWAIKKKWGDWGNAPDLRSYNEIKNNIFSELDLFRLGDGHKYY